MDHMVVNPVQPHAVATHEIIHSVVPIGGAPFIQPFRSMAAYQSDPSSSSSYSSFTERKSLSSRNGGNTGRQVKSPTSSPIITTSHLSDSSSDLSSSSNVSSPSLASSPSSASSSPTNWEAAIRYTSALHEHTRKMWEQERLSIERTRLGLSNENNVGGGHSHSHSTSLQKRSTLSGMEGIWKGRKRQSKRASISG